MLELAWDIFSFSVLLDRPSKEPATSSMPERLNLWPVCTVDPGTRLTLMKPAWEPWVSIPGSGLVRMAGRRIASDKVQWTLGTAPLHALPEIEILRIDDHRARIRLGRNKQAKTLEFVKSEGVGAAGEQYVLFDDRHEALLTYHKPRNDREILVGVMGSVVVLKLGPLGDDWPLFLFLDRIFEDLTLNASIAGTRSLRTESTLEHRLLHQA